MSTIYQSGSLVPSFQIKPEWVPLSQVSKSNQSGSLIQSFQINPEWFPLSQVSKSNQNGSPCPKFPNQTRVVTLSQVSKSNQNGSLVPSFQVKPVNQSCEPWTTRLPSLTSSVWKGHFLYNQISGQHGCYYV